MPPTCRVRSVRPLRTQPGLWAVDRVETSEASWEAAWSLASWLAESTLIVLPASSLKEAQPLDDALHENALKKLSGNGKRKCILLWISTQLNGVIVAEIRDKEDISDCVACFPVPFSSSKFLL